jgi:hypothetical protein
LPTPTPATIVDILDREIEAGLADAKIKVRLAGSAIRCFRRLNRR